MAILGVLTRIESAGREQTVGRLDRIDGVSTFSVDEHERIGLLVEAPSLALARELLATQVERAEGVMGAWPVFADFQDEILPSDALDAADGTC